MKNLQTLVFFGTHELASPALELLSGLGLVPQLIVTRPEAGLRRQDEEPAPHPVRAWAEDHGVKAVRSRRGLEPDLKEEIEKLAPDLVVVVDYGRPLPAELAAAARRGAIEVHPSMLPQLRGPHALRAAMAAGNRQTGVSVFQVTDEPWGGPVLAQEELEIGDKEHFVELLPRAQELSVKLLADVLKKYDRSKNAPKGKPQKDDKATEPPRLGGRHRKAPWTLEAPRIYDRLRAYSPLGLLAYYSYRPVRILAGMAMDWVDAPIGNTGTYLGMRNGKLAVLCGDNSVFGIERLCRPGSEPQGASTFARAEELRVGDHFS